jgi:hypothetical protein
MDQQTAPAVPNMYDTTGLSILVMGAGSSPYHAMQESMKKEECCQNLARRGDSGLCIPSFHRKRWLWVCVAQAAKGEVRRLKLGDA